MTSSTAALSEVTYRPFWLDTHDAPTPLAAHVGDTRADLAVIGGGFTGLWAALQAKEADPDLDVLLLEARTIGWAASGRNGGFTSASLTHGLANGAARWPEELETLQRLGHQNLDEIGKTVNRFGIDCDFERSGELTVATQSWQVDELAATAELDHQHGGASTLLDQAQTRAMVDSPTYLGSLYDRDSMAMIDPARLAWGLRDACLSLGVRIVENTAVTGVADGDGDRLRLKTGFGTVSVAKVLAGTGAFPALVRRVRPFVVPVYDYVLVTEPLSAEQRAAIGWDGRQGVGDSSNLFHYYRLTGDGRILWGGYDAVYYFGNRIEESLDRNAETFSMLAKHFFETFPQLEGLRFTHAWGGVIDTCSRFCAFWGTAYAGRLSYVLGYTGLGVGATRFGAQVALDLLAGAPTERTSLRMVRTKPIPFPPEPVRWAGIELTRRAIARADANGGRRGPWLRTLDRLGMGFDS
jgi:glycine/D-amino acid oxidase-like deaminating enzyme